MSQPGGLDRKFRFWFVGHAHIDAVWLWTFDETVGVIENTFSNVLRLMREYPWLTYAQSSTLYYEVFEKKSPQMFEELKKRVEEGRWELVGGSYVEFDANMPSGESLARQFLYGQRYLLERFGRTAEVGWLPDSFGYPVTLPQILAKSGIKYFYTQKPLWNDMADYPYHTFYWESPDGSRVLTYMFSSYSVSVSGEDLHKYEWARIVEGFDDYLIVFGEGDHGGGPRREDVETLSRWLAGRELPGGLPAEVRVSKSIDFFRALENRGEIPVFNDELYLQYHRGVFTTQAKNKWLLRRGEVLVDVAERLSTLTTLLGHRYPRTQLEELWKKVLLYQFHDAISGTYIREVGSDMKRDLEEVGSASSRMILDALKSVGLHVDTRGPGTPLLVFNPLTWGRRGLVEVEVERPGSYELVDEEGRRAPLQPLGDRAILFAAEAPPLGHKVYWLKSSGGVEEHQSQEGVHVKEDGGGILLENKWIRVRVDRKTGVIDELSLKEDRENVLGGGGIRLRIYDDVPVQGRKTLYRGADAVAYDAWEVYIHQQPGGAKYVDLADPEEVSIVERGPIRGIVRIKYKFRQEGREDSTFTVDVTLDCADPAVKLVVDVDWRAAHRFAKLVVPTSFYSEHSVAGAPFGHIVRRNPYSPEATLLERAKYEAPFQGWVSCSGGDLGLTVVSNTCYGYEHTGRALHISLLRAARYPPKLGSQRTEWLADREFTDQGQNTFAIKIYPHRGDWRLLGAVKKAFEDAYGLFAFSTDSHSGNLPPTHSFLEVQAENAVVTAFKVAEDGHGLVLRLYECEGRDCEVEFKTPLDVAEIEETNMVELGGSKIDGKSVTLRKHEVKTLRIHLKQK